MKYTRLSLFVLALFGTQIKAQSNPVKASIVVASQKFTDVFSSGTTCISDLYASDAELYPPSANVVKGNTAIGPIWKGACDAGIKKAGLETISADPVGAKGIEIGRYKLSGADDTSIDSGKYIVVRKKEKGGWKLFRDIWNTSQAAT